MNLKVHPFALLLLPFYCLEYGCDRWNLGSHCESRGHLEDGSLAISMVDQKGREGALVSDNLEATVPALDCQLPNIFYVGGKQNSILFKWLLFSILA